MSLICPTQVTNVTTANSPTFLVLDAVSDAMPDEVPDAVSDAMPNEVQDAVSDGVPNELLDGKYIVNLPCDTQITYYLLIIIKSN
jgi:hypothetical protein